MASSPSLYTPPPPANPSSLTQQSGDPGNITIADSACESARAGRFHCYQPTSERKSYCSSRTESLERVFRHAILIGSATPALSFVSCVAFRNIMHSQPSLFRNIIHGSRRFLGIICGWIAQRFLVRSKSVSPPALRQVCSNLFTSTGMEASW